MCKLYFMIIILFALATSCSAMCETAYFAFKTQRNSKEFIFQLTDSAKIRQARDILSGASLKDEVHVLGKIIKTRVEYNPDYDFHLDPSTIEFFSLATEVCDANLMHVEDHLDEACGAFLPGCYYCPWSSQLIREVCYNPF